MTDQLQPKTVLTLVALGKAGTYTYSEIMAEKIRDRLITFCTQISVIIVLYPNHEEVLNAVNKGSDTFGVQPVYNSSTGPVPLKVTEGLVKEEYNTVAGIDLPIPHHFMTKNPDLLKPEEYGQITHVYSHSAAIGQCQEIILKIKKVNPDVKIIRTESTADGAIIVSNLSGEEAMTSIAIGSLQAAQSLQLPHTDKPVQDYEDNRTTFLLINKPNNTDLKTFQTIKNTMRVDKVENEPNAKINFIINLNLTNDLGSLSCLIEELSSIPDLNMNFVQVEYAGGQNNIHPHISGVLPKLNISLLDTTLQRYTTDLKLTYTKVELDKKENSPQELLQMKSDSNNIEIKISKKDESDSLAITSIVPNTPGALASVLKEIKKKGINLTSLKIMAHGAQEYATLEATGSNYK